MVEFTEIASRNYRKGYISVEEYYKQTSAYSMFLKQPLELWQFIPCDPEGNVLEEPEQDDLSSSFFEKQTSFHSEKKYEAAKQHCLFEGFTYDRQYEVIVYEGMAYDIENKTIESFMQSYGKFKLTPTALNQIY